MLGRCAPPSAPKSLLLSVCRYDMDVVGWSPLLLPLLAIMQALRRGKEGADAETLLEKRTVRAPAESRGSGE